MPETTTLPKPRITNATDARSKRAPMWKVLFHNDDQTSMDFVVWVLMHFYGLDIDKAKAVMLEVHNTGQGLAGVYPQEVAELKKDQTVSAARGQKFPLVVTIEPDE